MRLYLARHGQSIATGLDDERPLSEKGRADIQNLSAAIAPLKIQVSRILQSQKNRAQQTAHILASSIEATEGIETRYELDPMAELDTIIDEVNARDEDILLVGHMPYLGRLVAKLTTANENKSVVSFQAGSMLCLEKKDPVQWVLLWMLTPELFI